MTITVQSSYLTTVPTGFPGMVYDGEASNRISRTVEDAAGIAFGTPCYRGAGNHGCTATVGQLGAPTNGALSSSAGGAIAATTYYVRSTWVTGSGETLAAAETSLAVAANNVLNVAAPANPPSGATGWNVYVSSATGTETKQNSTPLGLATAWVEPTTGLVTGAALPASNTSSASKFLGVVIADAGQVPGLGETADTIAQNRTAALLNEGVIWVNAAVAVNQGDLAYQTPAGAITNVATGNVPLPAHFDATISAAGLVPLRVIRQ